MKSQRNLMGLKQLKHIDTQVALLPGRCSALAATPPPTATDNQQIDGRMHMRRSAHATFQPAAPKAVNAIKPAARPPPAITPAAPATVPSHSNRASICAVARTQHAAAVPGQHGVTHSSTHRAIKRSNAASSSTPAKALRTSATRTDQPSKR
jgi:hypothetical protein